MNDTITRFFGHTISSDAFDRTLGVNRIVRFQFEDLFDSWPFVRDWILEPSPG